MFLDFFNKLFWGNTLGTWLIAFLIILGAVIASRTFYWVFKNIVRRYTKRSKGQLDDIFIDTMEEPVSFTIVLIGFWYAFDQYLSLSPLFQNWFDKLLYFLIVFNIAWAINRFFDAVANEYIVPLVQKSEGDLDDQLLPFVRKGIKIIVWSIAIIIGLNNAGYNVGALLAGLGVGGLAFALAAQDTIANLFGGFTILTDKPFKINDRIQVDNFDGFVTEIGMRSTRIHTLAGRMVTIPNSTISNNPSINVSSEPARNITLNLGLTYDMDHNKVQEAMDILKQLIQDKKDIVHEKYLLSFNAFGDFSLNILFIYGIRKEVDIFNAQTEMNMAILKRFNENGLEFAFPSQTIYTKQA